MIWWSHVSGKVWTVIEVTGQNIIATKESVIPSITKDLSPETSVNLDMV